LRELGTDGADPGKGAAPRREVTIPRSGLLLKFSEILDVECHLSSGALMDEKSDDRKQKLDRTSRSP